MTEKIKEVLQESVDKVMNGEFKLISRRSALCKPISDSNPQNLIWPAYPSYENPIVAFRYDRAHKLNF